jgi:orotidine-5'-phosphate decarboxylase
MVVTPGIRPVDNRAEDDQKRVLTVERAFAAGADYIVVGRPIRACRRPACRGRGYSGLYLGHLRFPEFDRVRTASE